VFERKEAKPVVDPKASFPTELECHDILSDQDIFELFKNQYNLFSPLRVLD